MVIFIKYEGFFKYSGMSNNAYSRPLRLTFVQLLHRIYMYIHIYSRYRGRYIGRSIKIRLPLFTLEAPR